MLCLLSPLGVASHSHLAKQNVANQAWFTQDPYHKENIQLRVDLFLSSTCPHCLAANQFFHQLESKKKWLSVHRYYVNQDKAALDRFNDLIQAQQITINAFAVPAIFFCDSRWLGFDNENNSGHQLLKSLNYCHQQLVASGKLTPTTVNAIRKSGVSEWYESNIVNSSSWVELIVSLAVSKLVDNSSIS